MTSPLEPEVGSRWRNRKSGKVVTVLRVGDSSTMPGGRRLQYLSDTAATPQNCHPGYFVEEYERLDSESSPGAVE